MYCKNDSYMWHIQIFLVRTVRFFCWMYSSVTWFHCFLYFCSMNSDYGCIVQPKHIAFYITIIKCCEWTLHLIVYVLASLIRRLNDTKDSLEILKRNVWLRLLEIKLVSFVCRACSVNCVCVCVYTHTHNSHHTMKIEKGTLENIVGDNFKSMRSVSIMLTVK
jgi:hypothetical protein